MGFASFLVLSLGLLAVSRVSLAAKEEEAHGARSPHERFEDEHYQGGKHNEDLDHQAILGEIFYVELQLRLPHSMLPSAAKI